MNTRQLPEWMVGIPAPRYYRHDEWPRCDAARIERLRRSVRIALNAWSAECNRPSPSSSAQERTMHRFYRAEARLGLARSQSAYNESLTAGGEA